MKTNINALRYSARLIKKDIIEISYRANVGHVGSAISIADILTVLFLSVLNLNPKKPKADGRDRFILSKGHAAAALYAVLYRKGFISRKNLLSFCEEGGAFGVHPVYDVKQGIELSTGSLGHGLSVGAGLALGLKMNGGKPLPRVFVLLSDAEINEGSTWEAIMFAAHHKLDNLVAIIDDNNYQGLGKAENVIKMQPLRKKWESFDWKSRTIDGHSIEQISKALNEIPFEKNAPSVIIAKTKTAKGISFLEDKQEAHYFPLSKTQYEIALKDLDNSKL